ncbi:MAG: hypothetical protein R3B81_17385 [bacterium]
MSGARHIRRRGLALAVAAGAMLTVAGTSRAGSPEQWLRGQGLGFPVGLPEYGQSIELVGTIDPADSESPIPLPTEGELTWTLTGPVVWDLEEPAPGIRIHRLTFGVLEIRWDSERNSAFLPNPPNALVPSTFHDGEALLFATLTELEIRDFFGIVTASGDLLFEGGTEFAGLGESRAWNFEAAVSIYGGGVPIGYGASWNVELTPAHPVSVQATSWGGIKSLYR